MRLLLAGAIVVASGLAGATAPGGQVVRNPQLIGWAASGECYAVDLEGADSYGIRLDRIEGYCGDELVTVRCVRPSGDCVKPDGVVDDTWVEPRKLFSDRWFQEHAVKPIDATMRDRFRDTFEVRDLKQTCGDQGCSWGWRIVDRATTKVISRGTLAWPSNDDRGVFVGGYLHPTKRFALLKFQFTGSSSNNRRAVFSLARW